MKQGWLWLAFIGWLLCLDGVPVQAQLQVGPWVAESDKRIDEARKTDLRVIVLNANGKPARGAEVHVEQLRGRFHVGYVLPETGWSEASEEAMDEGRPLWRCVNAVSLRRLTDWPTLQPAFGASLNYDGAKRIGKAIEEARNRGYYVRWGPVVSADLGRAPGWASDLSGDALAEAVTGYCDLISEEYRGQVNEFDVYSQWLTHDLLGERVGMALLREVYESLPAKCPGARMGVRFTDVLEIERLREMQRKLRSMREGFIPVDVVSLGEHFSGRMDRLQIERKLSRLDSLDRPVVFSDLTVGGDTELDASINMEMVLRSLMERPYVQGVWLTGWSPATATEPTGALFDHQGELLPVGRVVDRLFYNTWRTDVTEAADELGNVKVRAFPGTYRATAKLPDGTVIETMFVLDKAEGERVLLLAPRRPAGK